MALRGLTNIFKRMSSKLMVGADKEGNKFFTYEDPNDQKRPEKRMVEYRDREYPNPRSLHPLWSLWLGYKLKRAPSEKEIDLFNEEQRQLKLRVRDIEEQDAKLRLEEMAQREREGRDFNESYTSQTFLKNLLSRMQNEDSGVVTGNQTTDQALEAAKADLANQMQDQMRPNETPVRQPEPSQPPQQTQAPQRPFQRPGQFQQSSNPQQQKAAATEPTQTWNPNAKSDTNFDL